MKKKTCSSSLTISFFLFSCAARKKTVADNVRDGSSFEKVPWELNEIMNAKVLMMSTYG